MARNQEAVLGVNTVSGRGGVKAKQPKRKVPTEAQSRILRRIAQNGGVIMLTLDNKGVPRYSDAAGVTIDTPTAKIFVRNGWVEPQRDSLFDLTPQTWRIKSA